MGMGPQSHWPRPPTGRAVAPPHRCCPELTPLGSPSRNIGLNDPLATPAMGRGTERRWFPGCQVSSACGPPASPSPPPGPRALSAQHLCLTPVPGRCRQPLRPNGQISGGSSPSLGAGQGHSSHPVVHGGPRPAWAALGQLQGPPAPQLWGPGAVPSPDSLLGNMELKMSSPRGLALSRCVLPDGCHVSPGLTCAGGKGHTEGQSLGQGGAQPPTATLVDATPRAPPWGPPSSICQERDAHLPGPARSCTPHPRHPGAPSRCVPPGPGVAASDTVRLLRLPSRPG